jgi:ornithine cyclodeaminase
VPAADIISCATLSKESLISGDWLMPGQHLDLVGSFTSEMREVDDTSLQLADIYVDTRDGALQEAGELVQAMHHGLITNSDILGDLFDLTRGNCKGRLTDERVTLFKSVGTALEDLAAAQLVAAKLKNITV